jgi:ribosomal protein S18 acetylase RimI-like enzyme
MTIRLMRSSDLPLVSTMVRESFEPGHKAYFTYAQHGLSKFLQVRLADPESFRENLYLVATATDDQVIGFAEFTLGAMDTGFLSYICVAENARGLGVATSLIEHFILSRPSLRSLGLDVFHDNLPAIRLYEKLGFTQDSQSIWLRRHLPLPSTALSLTHSRSSAATHVSYGFCELQVEWQSQEIRLGRIGAHVLRCFDLKSFNNDELLAGARATFASLTEALTIVPAGEATAAAPGTVTLARVNRMVRTFNHKANDAVAGSIDVPSSSG